MALRTRRDHQPGAPGRARWSAAVLAAGIAGGAILAGCGAEDAATEPRPPSPIEITAKVNDERVTVSPQRFGAGLVVLTIDNQSSDPIQMNLDGPITATSSVIEPGQPGSMKAAFEQGEYDVTAGDESSAKPTTVRVGPERASSQNELLLP